MTIDDPLDACFGMQRANARPRRWFLQAGSAAQLRPGMAKAVGKLVVHAAVAALGLALGVYGGFSFGLLSGLIAY